MCSFEYLWYSAAGHGAFAPIRCKEKIPESSLAGPHYNCLLPSMTLVFQYSLENQIPLDRWYQ